MGRFVYTFYDETISLIRVITCRSESTKCRCDMDATHPQVLPGSQLIRFYINAVSTFDLLSNRRCHWLTSYHRMQVG